MRFSFLLIIVSLLGQSFAQELPVLKPTLGALIDKSPEKEKLFHEELKKCDPLWAKVEELGGIEGLNEEEKALLDICEGGPENYYDVLGPGCSWYCGGGQDTLSASSALRSIRNYTYEAKNIHDLSYATAWIEGVPGYGIGEKVTYHFPPQNPRITELIIVNGYVRSEKTWKENSRVKTLKMYLDGKPLVILQLEDLKNEQHFKVPDIGYAERKNYEELLKKPWYSITFEILEVYPGEKYDDTAITEIYFDGIDVH